jgi:hypothetical protein
MLTFFRRFRKELLDRGSTSKYLLYAIGEILLVMIGILLALQVCISPLFLGHFSLKGLGDFVD